MTASPQESQEPKEAATQGQQGDSGKDADPQEQPVEGDQFTTPERRIIQNWNEYDLGILTFKFGINLLVDWGTAAQDDESRQQVDVEDDVRPRDFRFSFSGRFKTSRSITYTSGLMYDGPSNSWFLRETGIQVAIPELWGNVFVGRQKEGFSLSKITVGYALPLMERMPMNDATIPILTDGIKWLGVHPSKRANWNLGLFRSFLPKNPSTGMYDRAVVARFCYLPLRSENEQDPLLHLGVGYHWGDFSDGEAQLRSRPELNVAPFFLDTGVFPANINHELGLEAYFRKGSWLFGSEYIFDQIRSAQTGNPLFHGGEAWVSWVVTGEVRPYHDVGGKLGFVVPRHSAFDKGPGAIEPVLHFSYTDFDDGPVQGGTFWRLTPHVNWYLDSMVRLEFAYGLGVLDRAGLTGTTHFFQSRLMIQIQ